MIQDIVLSTAITLNVLTNSALVSPFVVQPIPLAQQEISLDKRYGTSFVNDVFKDNILLNLSYLRGEIKSKEDINWDEVKQPFTYQFKLNPDEVFAFHDGLLPEYKDRVKITTNAHFNALEGFKSDGYLYGDGVCHLASLINWAARDAKLDVKSPTNHDFANIPEIPRQYGVSIYAQAGKDIGVSKQNLYITNNKDYPVVFKFSYQDNNLKVSIFKDN